MQSLGFYLGGRCISLPLCCPFPFFCPPPPPPPTHSLSITLSHAHTRMHACTHTHTRMHTYTHAHTRTHTRTQGNWKPQRIPNPSYFEDEHPFESLLTIHAIGFELWTMSAGIHFDNILITSELAVANLFAREGYGVLCGSKF